MSSVEIKSPMRGRRPGGRVSGREALLPVATRFFSRYGYEGASLRKIASEAGVDMALVARLFGSKSALWEAVLEYLLEKQRIHLAEIRDIDEHFSTNPENSFRRFIRQLITISIDIPEFPSLLLNEAARGEVRLDHLLRYLVSPFRESCLPVIKQAIAHDIINGKQPEIIFALLISAISLPIITPGLISQGAEQSSSFLDDMADEAIRLFAGSQIIF
ncbi:TetR/AcrR family transcriptional regulator [Sodalis sp. RH22]|uniref:TetR/AcrR family transcriptional regulator n=1 Tax=unclassified Sodalis (in: enterobacteria) TaxID=2636512 RepID=UPI0039B6C6DF